MLWERRDSPPLAQCQQHLGSRAVLRVLWCLGILLFQDPRPQCLASQTHYISLGLKVVPLVSFDLLSLSRELEAKKGPYYPTPVSLQPVVWPPTTPLPAGLKGCVWGLSPFLPSVSMLFLLAPGDSPALYIGLTKT